MGHDLGPLVGQGRALGFELSKLPFLGRQTGAQGDGSLAERVGPSVSFCAQQAATDRQHVVTVVCVFGDRR